MSNETLTRCALVTGGSRGIGRAVCLELARAGFAIAVNYAGNQQAAQETAEACRALGVKAESFAADVSRPEECARLFEEVLAAFGRVDVLVNNAGVTRDSLILCLSAEDFDKVLDTNLKGAFFCCKAAARPMMKQRFGRIINLTSVVGLRGNPGQTNYSASKAGLIGLTQSLAKELASRGITANAVAPGFIDTDMTRAMPEAAKAAMNGTIPLGRPGQPEEVARAVAFFASEESGYITGQVLCVDGGMAM